MTNSQIQIVQLCQTVLRVANLLISTPVGIFVRSTREEIVPIQNLAVSGVNVKVITQFICFTRENV